MAQQEEPVSPPSRILHVPCFDLCILVVMGFSTTIDVAYFKKSMEETIIKHPRFSSLIDIKDKKRYKLAWKRTKVNIEDHVFVPDVDPNMEFPDKFVENFTAELSTKPLDFSKPLWEDTNNPLRQPQLLDKARNRYVHRIVSLDDLKLIRKVMNTTINDVLLGATEFAVCQYLKKQYESCGETNQNFLKNRRIRFVVAVNLRDSMTVAGLSDVLEKGKKLEPGKWGNIVGSWSIPLKKFDDPLDYIRDVKATMDKRKMSQSPRVQNFFMRLVMVLFGAEAAARVTRGLFSSVTVGVSNVVGPSEEIILFGHPVSYISPTARGFPLGLIMHYHSYDKKMVISMAANEALIKDPHELCDYIQKYLEDVKQIVLQNLAGKDGI